MSQPAVDGLRVGDIGGHPLKDGRWFRAGLVFRVSGGMIGPAEIAHLGELGLRVLIDLRATDEDRSTLVDWAEASNVRYHHEPMALADPVAMAAMVTREGFTEADGRAFLGALYRRMIDEFAHAFVGSVRAVAEAQPVAFGCAAGKDRTGLLTALIQDLVGVDRAAILAGYVSQAPDPDRLRAVMGTWWEFEEGELFRPGVAGIVGAAEEVMAGALDYLDELHGGAEPFLERAGLEKDAIDLLKDRLITDEPT